MYSPRPSLTGHQADAAFSRASDAFPVEACIWEFRISPLSIPTAGEVHSAKTVFMSPHFYFIIANESFIYTFTYIHIMDDLVFSRTAKDSVSKTENLDKHILSTTRIY